MMQHNEFLDPFVQLLEDCADMAAVRRVEAGASFQPMWEAFEASGFLDALVPQSHGGAGLPLDMVYPLLEALGRFAVPVPVGDTMLARALLSGAGRAWPSGPIVLAPRCEPGKSMISPFGATASHALGQTGRQAFVIALDAASVSRSAVNNDVGATIRLSREAAQAAAFDLPEDAVLGASALVRATAIAGAAARALDMSVQYANERVQFGKPIGRQQAVQQQLAVMAEQVVGVRIASQMACSSSFPPRLEEVSVAKLMASIAAQEAATIAHAVRGAIGMSEEDDLQIFTRRLHAWRFADGAEGYWSERIGRHRIDRAALTSLEYLLGMQADVPQPLEDA